MHEMIENFVEVGHLFKDFPEFWAKIESGALHPIAAMREGTQHMMYTFKTNPTKYHPNNIQNIDFKFEELPDNVDLCANCKYQAAQ